ncbi:hypothetical protein BGX30_005573 [Mortierella sp. GBA39]|nr:hypothetical protein BGX30_005573 [Mortierella sp. GBA39]
MAPFIYDTLLGDRKRPYDELHNDSAEHPLMPEEFQDDANGVGSSVKVSLQQEADIDSDTATEATPATMKSELADGDTETEANLETLDTELSLPKAKNSPFYELVDYIYKKAQRKQVVLPNIPNDLTPIHSEMFRLARDELIKPEDVMKKKHVLQDSDFCIRSLSISSAVEAASIAPALQYESQTIRTLQEELLAALYPDAEEPGSMDVSNLRRTVYLYLVEAEQEPRKSKDDKERYAVLQILTLILLWLANKKFDKPSPEHVFGGVNI